MNQDHTLPQTIMEVEHGPWKDHFPLQTGLGPLPWLFQGEYIIFLHYDTR